MTYNPLIKNVYFIRTPQNIKSRNVTLPYPTRGLQPQLQSYSPSCYVSVLSMAHPIKPRHPPQKITIELQFYREPMKALSIRSTKARCKKKLSKDS